jgi:hypothetical protein
VHGARSDRDSFVSVDRIDRLVMVDTPLPEASHEPPDAVNQAIGANVASLATNGSTIQTGIGRIPDAVLASLSRHSDLGVHTEMLSDGIMRLADAGVINGTKKRLLPGKLVTSFVMGSRRLYEWANDHPALEMRRSGRLRARRRAKPARQGDHRAPVDREGRHREPHPGNVRGRRGRRDEPWRRSLRRDGARSRRPLGQEHPRARRGVDGDRAPRLSRGAPSSGTKAVLRRLSDVQRRPPRIAH